MKFVMTLLLIGLSWPVGGDWQNEVKEFEYPVMTNWMLGPLPPGWTAPELPWEDEGYSEWFFRGGKSRP